MKVVRVTVTAPTFVDPKGDFELMERVVFSSTGQLAFGEWLKKLSRRDTAPRGVCSDFVVKNVCFKR